MNANLWHALLCVGAISISYLTIFITRKSIRADSSIRKLLRIIGGITTAFGVLLFYQIPQEADFLLKTLNGIVIATFPIFCILIVLIYEKQKKNKMREINAHSYKGEDEQELATSMRDEGINDRMVA